MLIKFFCYKRRVSSQVDFSANANYSLETEENPPFYNGKSRCTLCTQKLDRVDQSLSLKFEQHRKKSGRDLQAYDEKLSSKNKIF